MFFFKVAVLIKYCFFCLICKASLIKDTRRENVRSISIQGFVKIKH